MNTLDESITVLLIDDEPGFAELVAELLQEEHDRLEPIPETNPEAGLQRLSDDDIDCIVCDYDMPDLDGIAVLESVRNDDPQLPFILFTGKGSEEVASEALSMGATDYLRKDHGTEQFELLSNRIINAVEAYRSQQQAATLKRIRSRVREANQQLITASSKEDAATRVCEILTASDPYQFAWMGEINHETNRIEPIAEAGTGNGYLENISITPDSSPTGQGPGGTAIRERRIVVSQDIREDPAFEPWRAEAIERGFESVAAIPLESDDTLHGVLAVYAARPRAFDRDERSLLSELASDLALTLDRFQVERHMEIQRQQYQDLFERAPVMYIVTLVEEDEPIIEYCNQEFCETLGYDRDEVKGSSALEFYTEASRQKALNGGLDRALNGQFSREERVLTACDGTEIITVVQTTPRRDEEGTIIGGLSLFFDVTDQREREEELTLYKTMVETVPDGVYAMDDDLHYIAVNDGMAELTGYPKEAIEGSHMSLIHDESGVQAAIESREELRERNEETATMVVEYDHFSAAADPIPCEVRFRPLPSDNGFSGTAGVVRDISDRKRRERELERFQTVVEATGDAVYTLDADGNLTYVNDAFCELVGYSKVELLGEYVDIVMDDHDIDRGEAVIRELLRGDEESRTWEMDLVAADGRRITVENHLALLPHEEEFRGTTGVHRDITARKERERELQRQNERLEKFTSIVSHDLQSPLNMAIGRLELAMEECDSDHLDEVHDAHDRMNDLISDLLELAQQGRVVEELEAVSLGELAEQCWRESATEDADLCVETDIRVRADPDRLRQLLDNLMRNAVEHGGNEVTVTLGALPNDAGFYVADDGPGISESDLPEVFEAGYSSTADGTGLGLSIVDEIAVAHGWTVQLTRSDHGGARFEIHPG